MPENTEALDIITTAQEAVASQELHPGIYYDGSAHEVIDIREQVREDEERPPARKTGAYNLTDVDSYIDALAKHGLPETELYANTKAGTIRAVINAHGTINDAGDAEGPAGWEDHTITLTLPKTKDWTDWTNGDGNLQAQTQFAEWIEDHLPNFVTPTGADMLGLAQTFQATSRVDFESSQRIKSGETQLTYKENGTASAGRKGDLAIPDTFTLALQPFERGEVYKVTARFRYRIHDGQLRLGYRLSRPDDVLRDAFDAVITRVETQAERTVWHA